MKVGKDNPCGFCGHSGTCTTGIAKRNGTDTPSSNCPNFYKFSFKSAAISTASGPSTNRPIACLPCKIRDGALGLYKDEYIFWSYNMPTHLVKEHPGVAVTEAFHDSYAVSADERERLGFSNSQKRKRGPSGGGSAKRVHVS